jgi:hypothetical protein
MVSISVVTVVILAALMVRYYVVRQAVRADAYETAARIGQLFLEGWRSTEWDTYEPYSILSTQVQMTGSTSGGSGPDVTADGFTAYKSPAGVLCYNVVQRNRHYHVALGYKIKNADPSGYTEYVIHVSVGFLNNYTVWDSAAHINYVKLTSQR